MDNSPPNLLDVRTVNGWLVGILSFVAIALLSTLVFIGKEVLVQQKEDSKQWQLLSVQYATTQEKVGNLTLALHETNTNLKGFQSEFSKIRYSSDQKIESLRSIFFEKTHGLDNRLTTLEARYE